jgi:hypothetical protein
VSRSVKNSNVCAVPSFDPSSDFMSPGTLATNFVETGRLFVGTMTSVRSSAHFASPPMSGVIVIGSFGSGLSVAVLSIIGFENPTISRT